MQILRHDDERLSWEGTISVERAVDWSQPWRIPIKDRNLHHEALLKRANLPAGVRLRVASTTRCLAGTVTADSGMKHLELYVDGILFGSVLMAGQSEFRFDGLPAG